MPKNRRPFHTEQPVDLSYSLGDVVKEMRDIKNVLYVILNRLEAVLRIFGKDGASQKTPPEE